MTALAVWALSVVPLWAGEWHSGASAVCSDCHTQHNSEDGRPMRTDDVATPARLLLRRGSTVELCLSCHDGTNPEAPDVIAPVLYSDDPSAGEFPNTGGVATNLAHHLENPSAEIPPGGTIPMVLTCTTCHDPHGNDNYRNLRPDPTRTGLAPVHVIAHQRTPASGSDPAAVYTASNVIFKSSVSAWCGQCHTALLDGSSSGSHHAVDRSIFGSPAASFPAWSAVTLRRVPVESPSDERIPSADDQVICVTCHKAHGSTNPFALIHADGISQESTCSECHS